jgi:hypothetical protein
MSIKVVKADSDFRVGLSNVCDASTNDLDASGGVAWYPPTLERLVAPSVTQVVKG